MNGYQHRLLTSYTASLAVLKSTPAVSGIPGFAAKIEETEAALRAIIQVGDHQTQPTAGLTARRDAALAALRDVILELAHDVTRFADDHARPDLDVLVDLSAADFNHARILDRPVLALRVIEAAASIGDEGAAYEITPERLAAAQAQLDATHQSIAEPLKAIKQKGAATKRLVQLFATLERLFTKHLDGLAFRLRHDTEFYVTYEGSRRVARSARKKKLPLPANLPSFTLEKLAA